jgi:hypothetical protein
MNRESNKLVNQAKDVLQLLITSLFRKSLLLKKTMLYAKLLMAKRTTRRERLLA